MLRVKVHNVLRFSFPFHLMQDLVPSTCRRHITKRHLVQAILNHSDGELWPPFVVVDPTHVFTALVQPSERPVVARGFVADRVQEIAAVEAPSLHLVWNQLADVLNDQRADADAMTLLFRHENRRDLAVFVAVDVDATFHCEITQLSLVVPARLRRVLSTQDRLEEHTNKMKN